MQKKLHSFVEAWINVLAGLSINFTVQLVIYPVLGIPVSLGQNITICAVFTVVSVTRSYCLRRLFNHITTRLLAGQILEDPDNYR